MPSSHRPVTSNPQPTSFDFTAPASNLIGYECDALRRATFHFSTAMIVAVVALLFVFYWLPEGDLHNAAIVQRLVSKLVLLSAVYFAVVIAAKNYKANKHLAVVNEHRQTSLQTFETFVSSAGDDAQTKSAVLLEATRTIFSPAVSGYLGADDENPNNRVVEVLKLVSGASGKS